MVIDFEKIAEAHLEGFKGGKGKLDTRNFVDDKVKIMYSTLRPGATTGLHTHEGNCEVVFVISGTATFHYDDSVEEVRARTGTLLPHEPCPLYGEPHRPRLGVSCHCARTSLIDPQKWQKENT